MKHKSTEVMSDQLEEFESWWNAHGQFGRAGGGDYEKTFAYLVWQADLAQSRAKITIDTAVHVCPERDIECGRNPALWCVNCSLKPRAKVSEDLIDAVSKAMRRSWQLGQTYCQQADSDYASQNKKSGETQQKFEQLVDETRALLAAQGDAPNCTGCNGNGVVGGLRADGYHSEECPFCKGFGIERGDAPVQADKTQQEDDGSHPCCGSPSMCGKACVERGRWIERQAVQQEGDTPDRVPDSGKMIGQGAAPDANKQEAKE